MLHYIISSLPVSHRTVYITVISPYSSLRKYNGHIWTLVGLFW